MILLVSQNVWTSCTVLRVYARRCWLEDETDIQILVYEARLSMKEDHILRFEIQHITALSDPIIQTTWQNMA